jgi:hypothetical protein
MATPWVPVTLAPTGMLTVGDNMYIINGAKISKTPIANPALIDYSWATLSSAALDFVTDGTYIYVANGDTVSRITISNAAVVTWATLAGALPKALVTDGTYIYAGNTNNTVSRITISDVTVVSAWVTFTVSITALVTNGTYTFVATSDRKISRITISDATVTPWGTPQNSSPYISSFLLIGNYIYGGSTGNVSRIDISTPTSTPWGSTLGNAGIRSLTTDGTFIYATNQNSTITKIQISNGFTWDSYIWATLPSGVRPSASVINGGYLYTANSGDNTVSKIFLLNTVLNPVSGLPDKPDPSMINNAWLSSIPTPNAFLIHGGYIYTSASINGIISRINIATKIVDNRWASSTNLTALITDGTYIYTANNNLAMSRIEISTGTVITTWANISSAQMRSLITDGTYIYTANGNNTVSRIEKSTGLFIQAWVTLTTGAKPQGLVISGLYIYTANENNTISRILISDGTFVNTWATLTPSTIGTALVTDDTYLYASHTNNTVSRINISSGQVDSAWATVTGGTLSTIVADATYIYTANSTTINRIKMSDAAVTSWANLSVGTLNRLSISDNNLYASSTGGIYRISTQSVSAPVVSMQGVTYPAGTQMLTNNGYVSLESLQLSDKPLISSDVVTDESGRQTMTPYSRRVLQLFNETKRANKKFVDPTSLVTYYHIELKVNGVVYANVFVRDS